MALVYMNISDKFKTSTVTIMHSPNCARSDSLVGGIPTPLKNMIQLGL